MTESGSPESMDLIRTAVRTLAEFDYPKVWIGKVGITAHDLLIRQELNDAGPEWLRIEAGESIDIEDTGLGLQIPGPSVDWLDGLYLLQEMPDALPVDVVPGFGDLQEEVACILAAKHGGVVIRTACKVRYEPGDYLNEADRCYIVAASYSPDGGALATILEGHETRFVSLDDLAPEDVDDDLIECLEFYSTDSWAPYLIEDSERARRALSERLGESARHDN